MQHPVVQEERGEGMATNQPDPLGDRLNRMLADLEALDQGIKYARNNSEKVASFLRDKQLEIEYVNILAGSLADIVRQQHDFLVLLEHRLGTEVFNDIQRGPTRGNDEAAE